MADPGSPRPERPWILGIFHPPRKEQASWPRQHPRPHPPSSQGERIHNAEVVKRDLKEGVTSVAPKALYIRADMRQALVIFDKPGCSIRLPEFSRLLQPPPRGLDGAGHDYNTGAPSTAMR